MNIKLDDESQDFFDEAYCFYQSGIIIRNSLQREQDENRLNGSIIYLFRHSMELLFKALIINHYIITGISDWENLKFEKRNITSIHSLQSLLKIIVAEKISLCVEKCDFNELRWIVTQVEILDMDSTFFRYPINKQKRRNDKSLDKALDIEAYRQAPCSIGAFLHGTSSEYYDSPSVIEIEDGLYEVLSCIFDEV